MNTSLEIIKDGLWSKNPGLVQLLGLCPLLAVSNSAVNALGLGLATIIVLTLSNLIISIIRKIIITEIRIMLYVCVIASLVTCVQLIMEAFMPDLYQTLGLYISLIATNCIIMARAEVFAVKNNCYYATIDGLANGIGFTLVLLFIGLIREFLGKGTIFSGMEQLFGDAARNMTTQIFNGDKGFIIAILPPGAFLSLGMLVALKNYIDNRYKIHKSKIKAARTTEISQPIPALNKN